MGRIRGHIGAHHDFIPLNQKLLQADNQNCTEKNPNSWYKCESKKALLAEDSLEKIAFSSFEEISVRSDPTGAAFAINILRKIEELAQL